MGAEGNVGKQDVAVVAVQGELVGLQDAVFGFMLRLAVGQVVLHALEEAVETFEPGLVGGEVFVGVAEEG